MDRQLPPGMGVVGLVPANPKLNDMIFYGDVSSPGTMWEDEGPYLTTAHLETDPVLKVNFRLQSDRDKFSAELVAVRSRVSAYINKRMEHGYLTVDADNREFFYGILQCVEQFRREYGASMVPHDLRRECVNAELLLRLAETTIFPPVEDHVAVNAQFVRKFILAYADHPNPFSLLEPYRDARMELPHGPFTQTTRAGNIRFSSNEHQKMYNSELQYLRGTPQTFSYLTEPEWGHVGTRLSPTEFTFRCWDYLKCVYQFTMRWGATNVPDDIQESEMAWRMMSDYNDVGPEPPFQGYLNRRN